MEWVIYRDRAEERRISLTYLQSLSQFDARKDLDDLRRELKNIEANLIKASQ